MLFGSIASRIHQSRAFSSKIRPGLQLSLRKPSPSKNVSPSSYFAWLTAGLLAVSTGTSVALCHEGDEVVTPPFSESALEFDHYNGVTLHLDKLEESSDFAENLKNALNFWKAEKRKGIWIHASTDKAHLLPVRDRFLFM